MNIKKLLAAAAVLTVFPMTLTAHADNEYPAVIGFSDLSWTFQDWNSSAVITGDGQYAIETDSVAGSPDLGICVIEIYDILEEHPDASAVLDKIEIDGKEMGFDAGKIKYYTAGDDGCYRIEIYSRYGSTMYDPGIEPDTSINKDLKLTFTVSGLDGVSEDEEPSVIPEVPAQLPDNNTASPYTGNTGISALIPAAVLSGALAALSVKKK